MKKIGSGDCYMALLAMHIAISDEKKIFNDNRNLKIWLANQALLASDTEKIGIKAAKRIFWLLSAVNGFVKREDKKVIISREGYKFLWADEFKRFEVFKESRESANISLKHPRYNGMSLRTKMIGKEKAVPIEKVLREINLPPGQIEYCGNGYKLIKHSHLSPRSNQAGFIKLILRLSLDKGCDSVSFAEIDAWMKGELHEYSKTQEIFFFIDGKGHMEIGDDRVPVKGGWLVIIDANVPHRLIPGLIPFEGQRLKGLVVSFPGWEGQEDYVIGTSKVANDGPSD